ncbi:hypothetical protein KP003_16590 [Geomonas nitrogeniifigens]|uniref:hypothetical protein n=1 Tax=Geomonas diazotrophica TaxID=2843197 RepID=UPI001C2B78D4|nr:hypothetical protein [Geomonas nitrogeniifigens]QXE85959.1 hypothetical protein KP003_16590 [Geomonas nitrogeniifigens]
MPARHYNLEYNVNGGPWLSGRLDETPGAGKQLTIGGLSVGTYAVKLRMVPLSGDTTPIVSNELVMQVGVPGISEPVVSINESVVTVADVIQRRDALLAAAGVTVSAGDVQVMNETLLSTASESGSVITGVADTITAAGESVATVATVQTMLEQVSAAISATATAADTYTPAASIPAAPTITSVTPGNTQNVIDLGTSSGATSYNLYWSTTETVAANIVASGTKITGASDPYTHSGLTNGTTYQYVQTAVNAAGESGPSAVVSGVPGAALTAVAVTSGNNKNYYSSDVVSWTVNATLLVSPSFATNKAIAYGNGVFVMLANGNSAGAVVYTSTDGRGWTYHATMPSSQRWQAIAWNGAVFCAVAYNTSKGNVCATSPDGVTWTQQTIAGATDYWYSIASIGSRLVMIATSSSSVAYSDDNGVTWSRITPLNAGGAWRDITSNGSLLVVVGSNQDHVWTSPDGANWTSRALGATATINSMAWNGSVWCGSAYSSLVYYSSDGTTWSSTAAPVANADWITAIGSTFALSVPSATSSYYTSTDAINWATRSTPGNISAAWQFGGSH